MTQAISFLLSSDSWIYGNILVTKKDLKLTSSSRKEIRRFHWRDERWGGNKFNFSAENILKLAFSLSILPHIFSKDWQLWQSSFFCFPNTIHAEGSPTLDAPRKAKSPIPSSLLSSKTFLSSSENLDAGW